MTEMFDEASQDRTPPEGTGRGRSRALIVTGVVLVVAFFGTTAFANFYTDRLWYRDLGFGQVFSTLLWTRVGLFAVFGGLMALVVCANIVIAYRSRPLFVSMPDQNGLDRYRETINPIRRWLVLAIAALMLVFAGTSGAAQWESFLLWRNGGEFGAKDQYFGKDIGFFVFDLSWLHYVVDFAMAAFVISVIAAAVTHYLYGGIRLQVPRDRLSGAAQAQLSLLLGLFVLAKGGDYYLDRFDLASQGGGLFTGISYTDDNAVLPAKNILIGISVICAVLFFLNVWRRTWMLPSVGAGLLALSAILLGIIWPGIVQQFQVKPSEADKEEPYIAKNIEATRQAYDLDDVDVIDYTSNSSAADASLGLLGSQLSSVPLVDPQLVRQTFEQVQQARAYYSVAQVLDVDRYVIDGIDRALVLGVRELDQSGINASDRNWSNLHTVYTHGNGLIAAYANQRPTDDSKQVVNGIEWAEGIEANQDALSSLGEGYESRIYFGEESPDYSVVGKSSADAASVELGLAGANADDDQTTTYDGAGGVDIGSGFRQLMYALKFGEPNFLLSGRVNENSEVLYNRTPRERVEKAAPWLNIDGDAYPAIVGGKVLWILDGYTASDRFPGSELESFDTMTDDSLQDTTTGLQALPTDELNYMRNAVKATVDAYDGTVTLYEWDEEDPILRAWESAFPGTVQPKASIPDELMEHLRYPEDLFKVQRYQFARYHVTDAGDWYQGNNRWEVPPDPNDARHLQPPYRLFSNRETEQGTTGDSTWSLTSVFVPYGKGNLASFVSVDSDATSPTYGQMQALELSDQGTDGPGLVANQISQDSAVRDALLPYTNGSSPPLNGNLLTLPVDDGLIFIEPIYAVTAGSTSGYPILQFVVVSYGSEVGIGQTLGDALANALGVDGAVDPGDTDPGGNGNGNGNGTGEGEEPGSGEGLSTNEQIRQLLSAADDAFAAANDALADGDLGEYQTQIARAQTLVERAVALANARDAAATDDPSASPSADPSASPSPSASPTS
ncbi:MAG: UPF0182 family protein [Actinobacteria bacterium]|uniref:Unannotated protein n=1 Tax=freshwater metagenome TaxID=449393 RepID=A0A6J6S8C5_9ZZZZ|nr:UPF0182 family protein [Actinomycetota bacterium]